MTDTIAAFWRITHDHINTDDYADLFRVGTEGPRNADITLPLTIRFRLLDDDGNLYYQGLAANDESLDYAHEFGMADAGATMLEVLENGVWVNVY